MEKKKARIEKWYAVHGILFGNVYGHPSFTDGTFIRTSAILNEDKEIIETKNTIYILGERLSGFRNEAPEQMIDGCADRA